MKARFSIVIPLYNKERHIERAINSVLNQSYPHFELIVVNDGSTDGSEKIVKNIQSQKLILINKKNGGESEARNAGIKKASNEYICFLDADDEWDRNFLEIISNLICSHPEVAGYATRIRNSALPEVKPTQLYQTKDNNVDFVIRNYFEELKNGIYPVTSSSVCIKKSTFSHTGLFNPKLKIGPDIDMWIRVFLQGGIALHNEFAATYHTDADNRSVSRPDFNSRELEFFEHIRREYLKKTLKEEYFVPLNAWTRNRIYQIIIRSILQDEKLFAIRVLILHIFDLNQKQILVAFARIIVPNKLVEYIKTHLASIK